MNTPGTRQTVMSIGFNTADKTIRYYYRDLIGPRTSPESYPAVFHFFPCLFKNLFKDGFLSFLSNLAVGLDMKTGAFYAHGVFGTSHLRIPVASLSYDENWIFNESTEITICSDVGSSSSIKCSISRVKLGYSAASFRTGFDIAGERLLLLRFINLTPFYS